MVTTYSIMRSGTTHFVLGIQTALLLGWNIYLPCNWTLALTNVLLTHLHGQYVSNTAIPGAHLGIFHLLDHYYSIVEAECREGGGECFSCLVHTRRFKSMLQSTANCSSPSYKIKTNYLRQSTLRHLSYLSRPRTN
jgi:hypothetical protein